MPRVVHFELLSADPERSVKFFEEDFGWTNQSWEGQTYWLVDTGKEELGINGGIMRASDFPHTQNALVTVDVEDIGGRAREGRGGRRQGHLPRAAGRRGRLGRLRRRSPGGGLRALEVRLSGRYPRLILKRLTSGVRSTLPDRSRALTRNTCLPGLSFL